MAEAGGRREEETEKEEEEVVVAAATTKKRARVSLLPEFEGDDPIVGLNVGGGLFYAHRRTLINESSSMLSARFGGDLLQAGDCTRDEDGRSVFFIDRDAHLFELVLSYLRSGCLPHQLDDYASDPRLWVALRSEAIYYGLEGLSTLLEVTHRRAPLDCLETLQHHATRCAYKYDGDREGLFYWLGTVRGRAEYKNPHTRGLVRVSCLADTLVGSRFGPESIPAIRRLAKVDERSRSCFVEHRPLAAIEPFAPDDAGSPVYLRTIPESTLLYCDDAISDHWAAVDLLHARLRPTHYSIRSACCSMDCWNFEGSHDAILWDTLHRGSPACALRAPETEEIQAFEDGVDRDINRDEAVVEFAERFRRTWRLEVDVFYRHFRITGLGSEEAVEERAGATSAATVLHDQFSTPSNSPQRSATHGTSYCLHGCGLELYGDVTEGNDDVATEDQ